MTGLRVCLTSAVALLLSAASVLAQDGYGYVPGPGYGPGPAGAGAWWTQPGPDPSAHWATPMTPHYQPGAGANWAYDDISGDNGGFYHHSPLDEFFKDMAADSYVRIEYLNWTFKKPNDRALGAPVAGVNEPLAPFPVTVGGIPVGEAVLPSLGNERLDDINGIKGTLGIPLYSGTLEASIFSFRDRTEFKEYFDLGDDPGLNPLIPVQYVATSTLLNNQVGTNLFLYDESFRMRYSADLWSSEVNYLWDSYLPDGLTFRPSVGFRYVGYDEQLQQVGSFNQLEQLVPSLVSVITAQTDNHVYSPQVGLRAEFNTRWVSLSAEPKLGVGVNVYDTVVFTERLRSQGEVSRRTSVSGEKIAVTGDLTLTGRIHVSEHFSVLCSYQIMFVDNVSRPETSIRYNDNGPNNPPDITADPGFELMYFQGINVGGEFRF